jgi:hypothetical protein
MKQHAICRDAVTKIANAKEKIIYFVPKLKILFDRVLETGKLKFQLCRY